MIFRHDLVAAAVEAHGVAKRNVEVQRQIGRRGVRVGGRAQIVGGVERFAELRCARIGRIPGTVRAVAREQVGAEQGVGRGHEHLCKEVARTGSGTMRVWQRFAKV